MILLALSLSQAASTVIDTTRLPHTVNLECRALSATADEVLRFNATIEYSGDTGGNRNHHVRVLVEPDGNDFPTALAMTTPEERRFYTRTPSASGEWQDEYLRYQFNIPSQFGSVIDEGAVSLEVTMDDPYRTPLAAGICNMTVEVHTQ